MNKPKKIIIVIVVAILIILIYFLFIKKNPDNQANLVSSTPSATPEGTTPAIPLAQDFLVDLLNIKSIKLDDSIFSDPAFATLVDSTIVLEPDGTEGRPNPFAPIGFDKVTTPLITTPATTTPATTVPATTPSIPPATTPAN